MAKMLSQIATIIRGSVGGVTFTANQFQQIIMRAKTSPVNPSTTRQGWIRTALGAASQQWNILTDTMREAWNDYADTLQFTGPLGPYTMPGRQIMVGNCCFVLYCNNILATPLVLDYEAPTAPGFAAYEVVKTVSPAAGVGFGVSLSNGSGVDMSALVERSIAFNPARQRYKGPFLSSTAQAVPTPDAQATLVQFSGLSDGAVYFVRIRGAETADKYRLTQETILRVVAETYVP